MITTTRRRIVPAVAAVLAMISSIAVAAGPVGPTVAAGHPLEVDPTTVELVDGVVVVARNDAVSVTFTNVSAGAVNPDELLLLYELPYLPLDDPLRATLTSIGVDPTDVVHETTSIQTNVDTCTTAPVAVGDSCTIEIQVLPQGLGTIRPFGTGIQLLDNFTGDVFADTFVIWPGGPPPPPPTDTTPPNVVITAPTDGAQLFAADLGTLAYTCTDSGTIGSEEILVDGQHGTTTLPSTLGSHTVEVRCTDDAGNTGSATVTYTVIPSLVVPDLETATYEDTPWSIDLLAGVTARPGASLSVVAVGAPQHGVVSSPAPSVTYTPATDFFGTDRFSYTVSDGTTTATATITVRVAAVNDLPVTVDDTLAVTAGQTASIDLLANDTDIDGDALQIVSVARATGSPSLGALTCPAVGPCTYQAPAGSAGGVETWTYRVIDSAGFADGQLTVTVTPPPPPPGGDHLTISLGGAITLSAGGPVTSGDITIIPPGTAGGGRIVGAGTVGTTTVAFNLVRPQNAPWFGSIRVYDASRGIDLWVPVFGATVRISPDGTYSATVTWFVISRTAPWIRPVTLTFSARDGG
jgi:hypothetical protein